jgi:hypothetical protein
VDHQIVFFVVFGLLIAIAFGAVWYQRRRNPSSCYEYNEIEQPKGDGVWVGWLSWVGATMFVLLFVAVVAIVGALLGVGIGPIIGVRFDEMWLTNVCALGGALVGLVVGYQLVRGMYREWQGGFLPVLAFVMVLSTLGAVLGDFLLMSFGLFPSGVSSYDGHAVMSVRTVWWTGGCLVGALVGLVAGILVVRRLRQDRLAAEQGPDSE